MQALAQRVSSAKICMNAKTHASIKEGILAYVCFEAGDEEEVIDKFISKIINFSFFIKERINSWQSELSSIAVIRDKIFSGVFIWWFNSKKP